MDKARQCYNDRVKGWVERSVKLLKEKKRIDGGRVYKEGMDKCMGRVAVETETMLPTLFPPPPPPPLHCSFFSTSSAFSV